MLFLKLVESLFIIANWLSFRFIIIPDKLQCILLGIKCKIILVVKPGNQLPSSRHYCRHDTISELHNIQIRCIYTGFTFDHVHTYTYERSTVAYFDIQFSLYFVNIRVSNNKSYFSFFFHK